MAERFLYLPLIGVSIALAVAYAAIEAASHRKLIAAGVLVSAIVLCNSHDYIRRSDFTFFTNMVRVVPNSAKARLGYGFALLKEGGMTKRPHNSRRGSALFPIFRNS